MQGAAIQLSTTPKTPESFGSIKPIVPKELDLVARLGSIDIGKSVENAIARKMGKV